MSAILFDFTHAPFDDLTEKEQQLINQSIDIEYFPANSLLISPQNEVDALYILMKGCVCEHSSLTDEDGSQTVYGIHDCFDTRALANGTTNIALIAVEDSLVFRIPRPVVLELIRRNTLFAAYFYQDIAQRLAILANRPQQKAMQSMLLSRVAQALVRSPCWLDAQASILDAAVQMQKSRTTSVLIRNQHQQIGIFTQSDLRNFVIDSHIQQVQAADAKVADYAHYQLYSIDAQSPIPEAMLIMAKHTIQRIVVTDQHEIVGILEQVDLLSFLTHDANMVSAHIERAQTLDDLTIAWKNTDLLVTQLHQQGVKVMHIAKLMRELRNKLHSAMMRMIFPEEIYAHVCLIVLGSEGRGEQILKTDQDNALIIKDDFDHPELPALCERFNHTLIGLGYPPCAGGIMMCNTSWRMTVKQYKTQLNLWMSEATTEHVMQMAIFVDAYPVCGNMALYDDLQQYWLRNLTQNDPFLARFTLPIEQFDTPLSLFSKLVTHRATQNGLTQHGLDIKKGGIFPIVHGIRSLALKAGLSVRNTYHRIEHLQQAQLLTAVMSEDLAESLAFLQGLQLKYGLQKTALGQPLNNLLDPDVLTTLERDLLKDTLAVVKRFKQLLRHHFHLNAL